MRYPGVRVAASVGCQGTGLSSMRHLGLNSGPLLGRKAPVPHGTGAFLFWGPCEGENPLDPARRTTSARATGVAERSDANAGGSRWSRAMSAPRASADPDVTPGG